MSWVITKKVIYIVTIAILFCSVVIYLWSGRPVEIVDVHYYSGKDINILARHFPITDRGKLNWWRENERKILEKYNVPENDFSVYIWDFGDGYQKLSPYDAEDEFYCFPDIKSESKCIKKDIYMSAESGGNYYRMFLFSGSGYFYQPKKDDDKLIESNNSTKLNQDKSHEKNHYH
ncbi:DUF943 family protein [Salmonella enterica]|uniref:DUF943 family protein n=5 Tax=Salmonella enterica TaxID=28901 RepID=A0A762V4W2_SALER|nr:DUF943 family protein [Salmonella enterica]EHY8745340.1 DUF943 family protein [Salmonella enterica subsp. enterica serovar Krefeld]EGP7668987.1 DUF943 family protein [Salmonella enterica]EHI5337136.1 DUF943 family protein [Salmonella enterica]EHJ3356239.1 DUF943 family protein [Salmonella enterica]EHY8762988.1 DUF943 family protein [Salmonella enterica subsp. enterica serovar Krefeld]